MFGVLLVDWTAVNEDWNHSRELFLNSSTTLISFYFSLPLSVLAGGLEGRLRYPRTIIKVGLEKAKPTVFLENI